MSTLGLSDMNTHAKLSLWLVKILLLALEFLLKHNTPQQSTFSHFGWLNLVKFFAILVFF